jgi:hypothetical protein
MLEAYRVVAAIGRKPERTLNRFQRLRRKRDWGFAHFFSAGSPP